MIPETRMWRVHTECPTLGRMRFIVWAPTRTLARLNFFGGCPRGCGPIVKGPAVIRKLPFGCPEQPPRSMVWIEAREKTLPRG